MPVTSTAAGVWGMSFTEQELRVLLDVLEEHLKIGGDEWGEAAEAQQTISWNYGKW